MAARGGARGGGPDVDAWIEKVCTGGGCELSGASQESIMELFWPAADPFTGRGCAAPGKKYHKKVFEMPKVQWHAALTLTEDSVPLASDQ